MGGSGGIGGSGAGGYSQATLETDPKNCGACGHDCLGGKCEGSVCQPLKLVDIPHEVVRTIGLSPDFVLVGGDEYMNGAAAIYTVGKQTGALNRTRPQRIDGSYSSRLVGTASTLVAADVYTQVGSPLYY